MVLSLILAWLWVLLVARQHATLRVIVEGGHVRAAPAWIRLRVQVAPDPLNRWLTVAIVSDGFGRSSLEQLDGARAPRTRWVEYPDVPAGVYTVQAIVARPPQRPWRAHAGFQVVGA